MGDWKTFADKIKGLLESKNLSTAKGELATGLEKLPNQFNLLIIANDVYRASGDRQKSLDYAELLITHHPDSPPGYIRAAQDLIVIKRFKQAQTKIQKGLGKFPNQFNLLIIANDVHRASGDRSKSLEYAELLITHHPDNWNGYGRSTRDLVALMRFEEAQATIQSGLEKLPNQLDLLIIAADLYSEMDEQSKSVHFASIISTKHRHKDNGCPYPIKQLIRNLRNRRNISENWVNFQSSIEGIMENDLSVFNLKWLKSICDTYVDHDESRRGLIAMSISMFLNTLKVGETSRFLHISDPIKLNVLPPKTEMYNGYAFLSLREQDACLTVSRRMKWILRSDPLMKAIWEEALSKIHTNSDLLKELKSLSSFPQRYFPIDPTGIKDVYGLTYEKLYRERHIC